MATLNSMKSGEEAQYALNGHQFKVSYSSSPSYGDDNRPVRGASVGRYTVTHPDGKQTRHEHGPNADTPAGRKAGANPNARGLAGADAWGAMMQSTSKLDQKAGVFRDRRTTPRFAQTTPTSK